MYTASSHRNNVPIIPKPRTASRLFLACTAALLIAGAYLTCRASEEATTPPVHRLPLRVALRNIDTLFLLRNPLSDAHTSNRSMLRTARADYERLIRDLPYSSGWHRSRTSVHADLIVDIPIVTARAARDGGDNYYVPHYYLDLRSGELGGGGEWCYIPESSRAILQKYCRQDGAENHA